MKQIFSGGTTAALSATAVNYSHVDHNQQQGHATITNRENLITEAGVLRYLRVESVAPGAGKSFTYTVMLNGVATSLEVVIANTDTSGEDITNTVSIAAGDRISLRSTPSGTPLAGSGARWASEFTPTTANRAVSGTSTETTLGSSSSTYLPIGSGGIGARGTTENTRNPVWNINATITAFYVLLRTAPGAGKSCTLTIMKNGVAEASSTITISDTNTAGNVTGLTIAVAPGDTFSMRHTPTGTPPGSTITWGVSYAPTTDGQWNVCGFDTGPSDTATNWNAISRGDYSGWATSEDRRVLPRAATGALTYSFKSLRLNLTVAPGAGKSRTVTLRESGASTALAVTVSETDTVGVTTADVPVEATWTLLGIQHAPAGTPTASTVRYALLAQGAVPSGGGGGGGQGKGGGGGRGRGGGNGQGGGRGNERFVASGRKRLRY